MPYVLTQMKRGTADFEFVFKHKPYVSEIRITEEFMRDFCYHTVPAHQPTKLQKFRRLVTRRVKSILFEIKWRATNAWAVIIHGYHD